MVPTPTTARQKRDLAVEELLRTEAKYVSDLKVSQRTECQGRAWLRKGELFRVFVSWRRSCCCVDPAQPSGLVCVLPTRAPAIFCFGFPPFLLSLVS